MPWLLKMTLYTALILAALDLYLGWRITKAITFIGMQSSTFWSWSVIVLIILFFIFPLTGLFLHLIGINVNVLEFPKPVLYLYWFGFVFSFQLVTWIIILDLIKLLVNYGIGINAPFIDRGFGWMVIGLSVVVLIISGTKLYRDTTRIITDKFSWNVKGLPAALDGFRLAHISDIQADTFTDINKIDRYITSLNRHEPDLVIFTGDLISYGTSKIEMAAEKMGKINSKYGIYAVIGDHDYWAGSENVVSALEEKGITVLNGENRDVVIRSDSIRITGVTEVYSRRVRKEEIADLTTDSTGNAIRIMASHQLSDLLLNAAKKNNYQLVLAGHTHGGQVRVPFFFRLFSASDMETKYVSAQYREDGLLINVNNGLGFTLAPIRYNAPATVSIIDFKKK